MIEGNLFLVVIKYLLINNNQSPCDKILPFLYVIVYVRNTNDSFHVFLQQLFIKKASFDANGCHFTYNIYNLYLVTTVFSVSTVFSVLCNRIGRKENVSVKKFDVTCIFK